MTHPDPDTNPFSTRFIQPDAMPFILPEGKLVGRDLSA